MARVGVRGRWGSKWFFGVERRDPGAGSGAELNRLRGEKVIFLVPAEYAGVVQRAYG